MHTLVDLLIHTDTRQSAILLPEDGTEIGYGSLSDQVDRLAARLRQSGLDPGQVVAIALPNGIEYLVAFLTATRARLIAAPMNPAYKAEEFRFFLEDFEARIVMTTSVWPLVRAHTVTWYSAVPTIHQILLARAASDNTDSLHRRSYASLA